MLVGGSCLNGVAVCHETNAISYLIRVFDYPRTPIFSGALRQTGQAHVFFLASRVQVRVIELRELSGVFSDIKSRTHAALSDNFITTYSFLSNQFLSLLKFFSRFSQK